MGMFSAVLGRNLQQSLRAASRAIRFGLDDRPPRNQGSADRFLVRWRGEANEYESASRECPEGGFTPVFPGHRVEQKSQAALSANALGYAHISNS